MSNSIFKIAYEIFAVDKFTDTFTKFSKGGAAADRALRGMTYAGMGFVTAGTAIGGALVYAAKEAAMFEREMSAVKAVSGASGRELEVLSAKAREMGEKTSFSAQEAAEGLKYLALAGWKTQEMLDGIQPVLYLAEAGNMELGRAADLASDTMAALGIKAKDTEYYLDRIAQTSRNSNTDVTQLMNAFRIGGGQLQSLNVPLEESASLFGIMANRGFKAEQAGRAMNAIIANMTTGFGRAGKAMEEIGVSAFDSQGNFIGLEATFRKVIEATKDMNDEDRNRIYMMIAGKDHIKTFNAILNGMGEEYDELKLKNINATGALTEMRNEMKNNLMGAIERLVSVTKELAIGFGDILLPAITGVMEFLIKIITWFTKLDASTKKTIVVTTALSSAFLIFQGVGLIVIGTAGRIFFAFKQLGVSISALLKVGGRLAGVFGLIATAGFKLYKNEADKAIDATVKFGDAVSEETAEAVDGYKSMASGVASELRSFADSHVAIDKDIAKKLLDSQAEFNRVSKANIEHRHTTELQAVEKHAAKLGATNDKEKQALLKKVDDHYKKELKVTEEANTKINEIINKASKEKRNLTEEETRTIEQLRTKTEERVISAIAKSQAEQTAIMEAFTNQRSALTTKEAGDAVKQSKKRRDEVVQQANEEFDEIVSLAINQRDVTGAISAEEAEAIIAEAEKQRAGIVGKAEEAHASVISSAQERAGENVALVDWETGEMLTGWDLFLAKLTEIWNQVMEVFSFIIPIYENIKRALGDMLEYITNALEPVIESWNNLWTEHGDTMAKVWEFIKKTIDVTLKVITTIIDVAFTFMVTTITGIMGGIIQIIGGALDVINGVFDVFAGLFTGDWSRMWEGVKKIVSGAWEIIKGGFQTFMHVGLAGILRKAVSKSLTAVAKWMTDLIGKVTGKIGDMLNAAKNFFQGIITAITGKSPEARREAGNLVKDMITAVTSKVGDFVSAGKDLIGGMIKGVTSKASDLAKSALDAAKGAVDSTLKFLGIKSPSRLFIKIAGFTVQGFVKGMDKHGGDMADATLENVEDVADAANTLDFTSPLDAIKGFRNDATKALSMNDLVLNFNEAQLAGVPKDFLNNVQDVDVSARKILTDDFNELDVSKGDAEIVEAIQELKEKVDNLEVTMDGESVGKVVEPHVTRKQNRSKYERQRRERSR